MHFSTLVLTALAVLSPITSSSPTPAESAVQDLEVFSLYGREAASCNYGPVTKMNIAYCNDCVPTGEGPPSCTHAYYAHFGAFGKGTCKDRTVPFSSACAAYGKIRTPFGLGTWNAQADPPCAATGGPGTGGGYIDPDDGSWRCACFHLDDHFSDNCGGAEYTCDQQWACNCRRLICS